MALVKNFQAETSLSNKIALNWDQPTGFSNEDSEVIVTKSITHYPMELFNPDFPTKATDSRPVEIFRGQVIVGLDTSAISVSSNTITDTSASFPIAPKLTGRLLRDSTGKVFTIISNTTTTVTLDGAPQNGKYVILADFPSTIRAQQNFESDVRTTSAPSSISNLVELVSGSLVLQNFEEDSLVNLFFKDSVSNMFVVKRNTASTVYFFEQYHFKNSSKVPFSYNTGTGVIQFSSAVNLSNVVTGDIFVDSSENKFTISSANDGLDQIVIAPGQVVDDSVPTKKEHGSAIIDETPVIGVGMALLTNFKDQPVIPYIDIYKNETEANARVGTGLLDNQFYYYTAFAKPTNTNVAQAEFSVYGSTGTQTQSSALSIKDRAFGELLYSYWPSLYRQLDSTGDLEDLMSVFGYEFQYLHALIETYRLQDTQTVFATACAALADQTGLASVGYSIGVDTLRRIAADMIQAWHLKGSKEGIALFIRILTTWDITNGTGDFAGSIIDYLPNVSALRFFDSLLGSTNTRMTQSDPSFTAGGRFVKGLPGIIIPGFFSFREFVVIIPEVALYVGTTTAFSAGNGQTVVTDTAANYGADNSLIGNFLLPNQEEVNDIYQIIGNTATTITVRGIVENRTFGGSYAVLSPLNTNRFIILNKLMPSYAPFGTKAGYQFT
jgi:hypothetical protein